MFSKFLILFFLLLLLPGCAGSDSENFETDSNSSESGTTVPEINTSSNLELRCGIIADGKFQSNPSSSLITRSERVDVEVLGSDTVIVTPLTGSNAGNKQLVKLHAISSSQVQSLRILHGIDVLKKALAQGAHFIPAGKNCDYVFPGGGLGVVGQIFSLEGKSMSELMLEQGSALPSNGETCLGEIMFDCYKGIPLTSRPPSDIELDMQSVSLNSECGSVRNGNLLNPVTTAELVKVNALSPSHVLVTRLLGVESGNSQIIKLHGLGEEGLTETAKQSATNFITLSSSPEAYLSTESLTCELEIEGSGIGVPGYLFTKNGQSINEELIRRGYAVNSTNDPCGGDKISACYQNIRDNAPVIEDPPPPQPGSGGGNETGSGDGFTENLIRNFLWKPKAERDGNLAILVNPLNVRVVVTGNVTETLTNTGPSNGRGTTARARRPGCSFGSAVVTFFNSSGAQIPVAGSGNSVTIPDGCKRVEFRR
ncbi:MAG TPA: hypothetical protein PKA63_01535 [Oligoflexia bacterium]|nr:hypothetical protein [Oligoflexia bacterium]HMP47331.1 hypothetical protein [Oligoflexia bacterium]